MQKRVSQIGGDYCFNLINSLIDYKGDIARNNKRNDGQITYSPDFSPNNIRRLILSADGVRIDFHISVDGRLSKIKPFSDAERLNLCKCIAMPDYKPMVWALADRVCSSIEEIIICTNNAVGANLVNELNISGLLRNRVPSSGDIKAEVSRRYKRLAYFTIVNCDINSLVKSTEVMSCNNSLKLISETEFVKSCGSSTKFKSDWYNSWGTTSAYTLDMKGSPLNEHFKKIKADVEELKKKSAVDSIKSERLKGIEERFNKAYKSYNGVYTCIMKLNVIIKTEGVCFFMRDVVSSLSLGSYKKPSDLKSEYTSLKSKEDLEQFIKSVTISASKLYAELAEWFLTAMCRLNKEYPLTVKVFLDTIERCITVPPTCEGLEADLGTKFNGVSISDSTSNICCYVCTLFVTDVGQHNMAKYQKKSTWFSNFEGGTNNEVK